MILPLFPFLKEHQQFDLFHKGQLKLKVQLLIKTHDIDHVFFEKHPLFKK
jgi:hypothetical protein